VQLAQTISSDHYFIKELLMLNNTLMKYSIHFSLVLHLQEKDSFTLCATPQTGKEIIRALHSVLEEFNEEDRIIRKGVWPPRYPDLNPLLFVLRMPTIHMTSRLYNRIRVKQFTTFSNVNCNRFPEICLKEFRHVSQQRVDILNIFYDGEYNINYYI
jgi:hypothetical protein